MCPTFACLAIWLSQQLKLMIGTNCNQVQLHFWNHWGVWFDFRWYREWHQWQWKNWDRLSGCSIGTCRNRLCALSWGWKKYESWVWNRYTGFLIKNYFLLVFAAVSRNWNILLIVSPWSSSVDNLFFCACWTVAWILFVTLVAWKIRVLAVADNMAGLYLKPTNVNLWFAKTFKSKWCRWFSWILKRVRVYTPSDL